MAAALTGYEEYLEAMMGDDGEESGVRYEACEYRSELYHLRIIDIGFHDDGEPDLLDGKENFDVAERLDLQFRTQRDCIRTGSVRIG